MIRVFKPLLFLVAFSFLFTTSEVFSQSGYKLGDKQELKVSGTSSLHDWDMISQDANGEATITINGQKIQDIKKLIVTFPVQTLTSGNSRMDRNAYESIDADKHTHVRFELAEIRNISAGSVQAAGNLTIAGQTRRVLVQTDFNVVGNTLNFEGSFDIKFSQFDVDPPTALLGTVRTGDDLKISFNVDFVPTGATK